ncbi:hypothetical protein AJ88_10720 [Mesorhizobium amorphae CCBAU 01583]|nr:hypothetical protein AJ88_10720 [Mesorhizobium amorphae CCBAU 01583]
MRRDPGPDVLRGGNQRIDRIRIDAKARGVYVDEGVPLAPWAIWTGTVRPSPTRSSSVHRKNAKPSRKATAWQRPFFNVARSSTRPAGVRNPNSKTPSYPGIVGPTSPNSIKVVAAPIVA